MWQYETVTFHCGDKRGSAECLWEGERLYLCSGMSKSKEWTSQLPEGHCRHRFNTEEDRITVWTHLQRNISLENLSFRKLLQMLTELYGCFWGHGKLQISSCFIGCDIDHRAVSQWCKKHITSPFKHRESFALHFNIMFGIKIAKVKVTKCQNPEGSSDEQWQRKEENTFLSSVKYWKNFSCLGLKW